MKKYVLLSLCLILLLALESCGNSGSEDSGNEADMQEFPSFTGLDLDGNSVNSDIFSERLLISGSAAVPLVSENCQNWTLSTRNLRKKAVL